MDDDDFLLGFNLDKEEKFNYSLSDFLKTCNEDYFESEGYLERFTKALDEKVKILPSNPEYAPIAAGLEMIASRICEELININPEVYSKSTKRSAGSLYAGLKVGLPHEADFVIDIPQHLQVLSVHDFQKQIQEICSKKSENLLKDLDDWIIHGVHPHRVGVCLDNCKTGVCLVLEYRRHGSHATAFGVTADIVPVHKVPRNEAQALELTDMAQSYLKNHCPHYKNTGWDNDVYFLLSGYGEEFDRFDTGLIENWILRGLNEKTKRALRVTKYLVQQLDGGHDVDISSYIPQNSIQPGGAMLHFDINDYIQYSGIMDKQKSVQLYGYRPHIKSYYLRLCFLHFLFRTADNPVVQNAPSGVIVLCLFDILRCLFETSVMKFIYLYNPLQKHSHTPVFSHAMTSNLLKCIQKSFLQHAEQNNISHYKLLNYSTNTTDKYQHFCSRIEDHILNRL